MRTIWLVIKHDFLATIRQRSFWILTMLMPALLLALQAYGVYKSNSEEVVPTTQEQDPSGTPRSSFANFPEVGLVDESGILSTMPPGFPENLFLRYPDSASARAALEAEEILQYVYVPADYLATGDVFVFAKSFQIRSSGEDMGVAFRSDHEWVLNSLLEFGISQDARFVSALRNPVPGESMNLHVLQPPDQAESNDLALAELVSSLIPYMFYFLLLLGSNYLMRSVVAEKENRTVEVLLLSLDPRMLMIGKILALSGVVVLQLVIWVGGGLLILNRGAVLLQVTAFQFPPGFLLWAALFLLLGYLLFATAMAAAGAIANSAREGAQMTWVLIIPLLPTLMFGTLFIDEPEHILTLFLSLFPFSAPSAMTTRLALGEVPLWQILVSLGGLAATTYGFLILGARFFKSGNLLSKAAFSWRRMATGWKPG